MYHHIKHHAAHHARRISQKARSTYTRLSYIRSSRFLVSSFFGLAVVFTAMGFYGLNQPASNAANDCNTNDIVASGIHSQGDVTRNYNANTCGDFRSIYDHYWIRAQLAPGDRVYSGTANNRGEVVANGRVVANNASSIGRFPIKFSHPISIGGKTYYETSHVGGQAFANPNASLSTFVVLDSAGNFKYAVINNCGNPIYARPVPPPAPPKPVVRDIQVCVLSTRKIATIKEDQFNPQLHSKTLSDCDEKYTEACLLATKQWVTIKESEYNTAKYSKNPADCETVISVCDLASGSTIQINEKLYDTNKHSKNPADCEKIQVCVLAIKQIGTIKASGFDATKHSKNLDDCKVPENLIVCNLATKQSVTITKDMYDTAKYSTNLKDCEAKCPIKGLENLPVASKDCVTPVELPKTGPTSLFSAGIGFAAMGLAAHYYIASRRRF